MKKMIVTHGVKGGVGKSMMSSLLVDYALVNKKEDKILILEADGLVPDVGKRYAKIVKSKVAPVLDTESLYRLLADVENEDIQNADTIILNLPANSQAIDECADEFIEIMHELDFEVRTIFMIAETEDSAQLANKSLESGLVKHSDCALAVVNQKHGRYAEDFFWTDSEERKAFLNAGIQESFLPELPAALAGLDELKTGAFHTLTKPDSILKIVDRVRLKKWLKNAHEPCEIIFDAK